jgi:hypothetical protein
MRGSRTQGRRFRWIMMQDRNHSCGAHNRRRRRNRF